MRFSIDNKVFCAFVALLAVAGCSPLAFYNTVVPHDAGARLASKSVAYGPGPRRTLDVYVPETRTAGPPPPIVVFFYGGSWRTGAKERYAFVGKALAARGAIVVIPDYRLVPDVRYPDFIEDNAAAVAWVRRNGAAAGGDPDRIYLMGHSAGAFNAALLALESRHLEQAGAEPKAIAGVIGISGPYDFDPDEYAITRAAFKGSLDDPDVVPTNHVRKDAPPMLLLHGAADDTVYPRNTEALTKALEEAGASVETHFYADLGHAGSLLALSRPLRGSAPILDEVTVFLGLENPSP